MICSRWWRASALDVTSNPPAGRAGESRDGVFHLTQVAHIYGLDFHACRWRHRLDDGELADPGGPSASRRTAARVMPGAICFRTSSHLPLKLYSNCMNSVALRPGRDRVSTNPLPTGSATLTNTIGTLRVARSRDPNAVVPEDTTTSGASPAANLPRAGEPLRAGRGPRNNRSANFRPSTQPS